jgi:hypothetical protein
MDIQAFNFKYLELKCFWCLIINSIPLNKNYSDLSGNIPNIYYNTSCSSFADNGYSSYFSLNSNITTNLF